MRGLPFCCGPRFSVLHRSLNVVKAHRSPARLAADLDQPLNCLPYSSMIHARSLFTSATHCVASSALISPARHSFLAPDAAPWRIWGRRRDFWPGARRRPSRHACGLNVSFFLHTCTRLKQAQVGGCVRECGAEKACRSMGQHEKPEAPRGRVQAEVHLLFVRANTQTDPNMHAAAFFKPCAARQFTAAAIMGI
ncbi:hypothetical protein D3C84_623550 [compost metagenome]